MRRAVMVGDVAALGHIGGLPGRLGRGEGGQGTPRKELRRRGGSSPRAVFSSVVFPQPLGPSSDGDAAGGESRVTSSRTGVPR